MTSVLQQLRIKTAHHHEELENTAPFSALMTDHFTKDSYTTLLLTLRAFHGKIYEATLMVPSHPVAALLDAEAVCQALDADLRALTPTPVPAFDVPFSLSGESNNLVAGGYVWLGSSMGAKMIYRWLSQNASSSLPMRYYQTLSNCSQNWAAYRQYLDTLTLSSQDRDQVCRCAAALFSGIKATAIAINNAAQPA